MHKKMQEYCFQKNVFQTMSKIITNRTEWIGLESACCIETIGSMYFSALKKKEWIVLMTSIVITWPQEIEKKCTFFSGLQGGKSLIVSESD